MKIMMTNKYNLISVLGIVAVLGIVLSVGYVYAKPIIFPPSYKTATATTSPIYLTFGGEKGGVGTTTAPYDSYRRTQGSTDNDPTGAIKATALIQFSGSSSLSQLLISRED